MPGRSIPGVVKGRPKNKFRQVFITLRVMSPKAAVSSAWRSPITRSVMATTSGNREVVFRPALNLDTDRLRRAPNVRAVTFALLTEISVIG